MGNPGLPTRLDFPDRLLFVQALSILVSLLTGLPNYVRNPVASATY